MKTSEKSQPASLKRNLGRLLDRYQPTRTAAAPAEHCHFAKMGSGPKISLQKFNLRRFEKVTLGSWYLKLLRCSADSVQEVQGNGTVGIRPATVLQDGAVRGWDGGAGLPSCCGAESEQAKGWWASFSPQKLHSELRQNCYSCWFAHTGSVSLLPLVQCFYSGVFCSVHHMQGKYNEYFSEKDWYWTLHSRQLHSKNVHCLLNTAFLRNCFQLEKAPTNPVVLHFCSWIWSFSLQLNHVQFCKWK